MKKFNKAAIVHFARADHEFVAGFEAEALEQLNKEMLEVLKQIANSPCPFNEPEFRSWHDTARNLANSIIAKAEEV